MFRCANRWWILLGVAIPLASAGAATFPLELRTNGASASFRLAMDGLEIRFQKEPEYAGRGVVRSALRVGPDPQDYLGFACDLEAKKLYLDLNRNLDLTDDPDGVHASRGEHWGSSFEDVVVPIEQAGRRREIRMDVTIYGADYGRYAVKSSWEGAVEIGGRTFHVAVVDDGNGVIDAADELRLEARKPRAKKPDPAAEVELQAPATLVLDGEPFGMAYGLSADGKTLALEIAPKPAMLAEVELAGEGIERVVLQDQDVAAVFLAPDKVLRLPAGRYRGGVRVRTGQGKDALLWQAWGVSRRVADGARETWRVGGPIVSKLTCRNAGNQLVFDHALAGAGGEKYATVGLVRESLGPPKLRVRKDGQTVHVGNFEYG